jgi:hypothetical protein
MLELGRSRLEEQMPNTCGHIKQMMDLWEVDAVGQFNPEGLGDCWALAFQGARSDGERVEMPHAQLTIHWIRRDIDVIRRRLVRSRKPVGVSERASATRLRETVWSTMAKLGPRVWGDIDAARRDVTLPAFRRKLLDMGKTRWMAKPGSEMAVFEGSEVFSVLSHVLQVHVVSMEMTGTNRPDTNPLVQFHDASSGGMQDSRITTLAQAIHEVKASGLPSAFVMYGNEHYHCFLPMSEETMAPYSAQLAALDEQRIAPPRRESSERVAAGGSGGMPFPAWYGEEEEGLHGRVATAYAWCCFHNNGTGAYLKKSESFLEGIHALPSFRYCTGCADTAKTRAAPRRTGPTMEQCLAHVPHLSKQRKHIFTVTCCYDGNLAAIRARENEDPDAAKRAAEAAEVRAVRLVCMRLSTLEQDVPASAVESSFLRRRAHWMAELETENTLLGMRALGEELANSILPGALPYVAEHEAVACITSFSDSQATCTSVDEMAINVSTLSSGLGFTGSR